jgi:hypothetical protein
MPSGGSHPRYSQELRSLLEVRLQADLRTFNIARSLRVSGSFVSQLRGRFEVFSTVSPSHPGV